MKFWIALTALLLFLGPGDSQAVNTYSGPLIAGTGVPVAPATNLPDLGRMPSQDELALLYAMTETPVAELPTVLVELGLDWAWWQANLEVSAFEIPYFLPEGSDYDVFVEIVHPPTGDQTGCYARAGTATWVCGSGWAASPSYPRFMTPQDFVDWLFPVAWYNPFGSEAGSSLQWNCRELRQNSGNADLAAAGGFLGGGSAAVAGIFGSSSGVAIASAVYAWAVPAAAFGSVPLSSMLLGAAAVAGPVLLAAAVAGAVGAGVAYYAYTSGVGPGVNCPGCGAGQDPAKWECSANPDTDICTCTPREADGNGGTWSDDSEGTTHDPNNPPGGTGGPLGTGWPTGLIEYDSCEEWTNFKAGAEECDGCWDDEPEIMKPETDGHSDPVGSFCRVCTEGTQNSLGNRICITGTTGVAP